MVRRTAMAEVTQRMTTMILMVRMHRDTRSATMSQSITTITTATFTGPTFTIIMVALQRTTLWPIYPCMHNFGTK